MANGNDGHSIEMMTNIDAYSREHLLGSYPDQSGEEHTSMYMGSVPNLPTEPNQVHGDGNDYGSNNMLIMGQVYDQ